MNHRCDVLDFEVYSHRLHECTLLFEPLCVTRSSARYSRVLIIGVVRHNYHPRKLTFFLLSCLHAAITRFKTTRSRCNGCDGRRIMTGELTHAIPHSVSSAELPAVAIPFVLLLVPPMHMRSCDQTCNKSLIFGTCKCVKPCERDRTSTTHACFCTSIQTNLRVLKQR